jgi:hypothetical protein
MENQREKYLHNSLYVLKNKIPVPEPDIRKWGVWRRLNTRVVKKTNFAPDIEVSTVFLGVDYSSGNGELQVFETFVFGGLLDGEQTRCATWEEAEVIHKDMCARVKDVASL